MSIQDSASLGRLRAMKKWPNSKLVIADLLRHRLKTQKSIWTKQTRKWIKGFLLKEAMTKNKSEIKDEIRNLYALRATKKPSLAMRIAIKYNLRIIVYKIKLQDALMYSA